MEDNIYTLKSDIQECVVNNMNLKNDYRVLLFDRNTTHLLQSLKSFEHLEIFPNNSLMRFQGEIAKDLIAGMNEEDLSKIKKIVWQNNVVNLMKQKKDSNKPEYIKKNEQIMAEIKLAEVLQECENKEYEYRQATKDERTTMKSIQRELDIMGLNLDYEEHKEILMLSGNFEYLSFTKEELRYLVNLIIDNNIDNFVIAPLYSEEDEEDEECKAIRIVLAIDLAKED